MRSEALWPRTILSQNPKSKGNGKGKGKGKDIKGKDKAKDVKNESSNETKSDDQIKCFYCNKNRSREGRVQKEAERPCRGRGETCRSVATSTRHSSDRAFTVRTPRRETLVNVCHSHALREQRNVLRVFPVSRP